MYQILTRYLHCFRLVSCSIMRENDMMNGFCMLCGEQIFIPIGHEACHKMRGNRMQFDLCVKCAAKNTIHRIK